MQLPQHNISPGHHNIFPKYNCSFHYYSLFKSFNTLYYQSKHASPVSIIIQYMPKVRGREWMTAAIRPQRSRHQLHSAGIKLDSRIWKKWGKGVSLLLSEENPTSQRVTYTKKKNSNNNNIGVIFLQYSQALIGVHASLLFHTIQTLDLLFLTEVMVHYTLAPETETRRLSRSP